MENAQFNYLPMKKKASAGTIVLIIVSCVVVVACAALMAVSLSARSTQPFGSEPNATLLSATGIPTDSDGFNTRGTSPELLISGGLSTTQKEWTFYADNSKGGNGCLYADNGKNTVKLTDFPVANINVVGDELVFTDICRSSVDYIDTSSEKESYIFGSDATYDKVYSYAEKAAGKEPVNVTFAGRLYKITGVSAFLESGDETLLSEAQSLGSAIRAYFSVMATPNGIYTFSRSDEDGSIELWNISGGEDILLMREGDDVHIKNVCYTGDYAYACVDRIDSERLDKIVKVNLNAVEFDGEIEGTDVFAFGNRIYFIGGDSYVYELIEGETEAKCISFVPVNSLRMLDNGDLSITFKGDEKGLLSLNGDYSMFSWRIRKEVGEWHNYLYTAFGAGYKRPAVKKAPKPEPKEPTPIIKPKEKISPANAVEMLLYLTRDGELSNPLFDIYNEQQKEAFYTLYGYSAGMEFADYMQNVIIKGRTVSGFDFATTEEDSKLIVDMLFSFLNQCEYTIGEGEKQADGSYLVPVHVTKTFNIDYFINSLYDATSDNSKIAELVYPYMDAHGITMNDVAKMSDQELVDFAFDITLDYMQNNIVPNCMMDCDVTFNAVVVEDEDVYYKVQNYDEAILMVYMGKTDGFSYDE